MPKKFIGIFIFMLLIATSIPKVNSISDIKPCSTFKNNIQAITLGNITEIQKIFPYDGAADDFFGYSVSINGNYSLIGAPRDDSIGEMSGSAYIFKRTGINWIQEAKILPSDGASFDYFGYSVSLYGDYAIVGAFLDDDKGDNSGSAYIFKREGSSWSQQAKLLASDGEEGDHFGVSVSINGDYALIGAKDDNDHGENSGSAYIFNHEGSSWFQQAKILASDGALGDSFGFSVSIEGEYALIGAPLEDNNGPDSGAAYIFERFGTIWLQQVKLISPDGEEYDWFGYSVSIYDYYVIIGVPNDDDEGYNSGSAYIFEFTGLIWSQEAKLLPIGGAEEDFFGCSVSLYVEYAIIGAILNNDNGLDSGAAYFFKTDGNKWIQQSELFASDGNDEDEFGWSVSIYGDFGLIGVPNDDVKGDKSGSAYIFLFSVPPNTPNITGPVKFKPNENKEFTFTTTDPDGDYIYFYIDWGDGNVLDWKGPFATGAQYKASHNWSEQDIFIIKCKAKDIHDLESDWGTLRISTTRTKMLTSIFFIFLETHSNLFSIFQKILNRIGK